MTGHLVWVDIPTVDLERAIGFYSAVLDVKVHRRLDHPIAVFAHEPGRPSANLFYSPDVKPSQQGAIIYLSVEGRLKQACDLVERFGGQVTRAPHSIEPFGNRALIRDSEGNKIALYSKG